MSDHDAGESRRHPSAGNLSSRPQLVRPDEPVEPLPPASFPHGAQDDRPGIRLGPDLDNATLAKLLGPLEGRKVLDLGCGAGQAAVSMARSGARVTAVEPSAGRLTRARNAAEMAEVRIEFHHGDPADLAFVRADTMDAALAVYSLSEVDDLSRVFRQVHRVLSSDAPFVLSLPHPFATMLEQDPQEQPSPWLARTQWSTDPVNWRVGGDDGRTHVHQISDVFVALTRSNFRVDTILEPRPEPGIQPARHRDAIHDWVAPTLVIRARKQGL